MTINVQNNDKLKKDYHEKIVNIEDIDLQKLRKRLGHGDIKEIAERTDFTPDYVSKVLNINNKRFNSFIIKAALSLIEEKYEIKINEALADTLTK